MTVSVWNPSLAYSPASPRVKAPAAPPRRARRADSAELKRVESSGALEVILSADLAKRKRRKSYSLVK